jgi:hypothetical protein
MTIATLLLAKNSVVVCACLAMAQALVPVMLGHFPSI